MKELLDVITKVRDRIHKYREELQKNEMLTRYVLIDPILRALGWDTENPNQVVPEIQLSRGRPDYALLYNQEILVIIEAKALGADISNFEEDVIKYCSSDNVTYFVITNGDVWELQKLSKGRGKKIFSIQISKDNLEIAARKLLAIWKEAMPNIESAPDSIIYSSNLTSSIPKKLQRLALSELKQMDFSYKELSAILYLDKDTVRVRKWKDLLVEIARFALPYLQKQKKLPLRNIIRNKKQKKHMISPENLDGEWFVETKYSANDCVRNAINILEEARINPSVKYNESDNLVEIEFRV